MTAEELARYIDHSVLKPEFSEAEIREQIQKGIDYKCKTVCVNPASVDIAYELCHGTDTEVCVVCDFPFGLSTTASKVQQAKILCETGKVFELDIVSNYGWIRSGKWEDVRNDIKAVVDECHKYNVPVKTILETDALTVEEVRMATEMVVQAGSDFVKTSTGFLTGHEAHGATPEIIAEMMEVVNGRAQIKGAGCIRTQEHFFKLIDMGIDRMGVGYKSTPVVLDVKK